MSPQTDLKPSIGLYATTALVVGAVIGSGIFISPASMARYSSSGTTLIAVWLVAGLLTMIGALIQCELCSTFPKTGGLYVYLREAFGDRVAFFYGWANFMIAGSGALAAISFIFASYLNEFIPLWHPSAEFQSWSISIPYLGTLFPLADIGEKVVASALVLALTWLNTRGIKVGAGVQSVSTTIKVVALVLLVLAAYFSPQGSFENIKSSQPISGTLGIWQTLGMAAVALSGAFWSYDGWGNVTYVAGEVKNPRRTVPRALILGCSLVIFIYISVNLAYLYVFPVQSMGQVEGDRIASALMNHAFGPLGVQVVALIILVSTFDTTNSGILTNSRVYYAMAQEGLFPRRVGSVHNRFGTPHIALWAQGVWTVALIVSGSFDLVTSMYVWVNWLFYLLMAAAVFVFRRQNKQRAFSTWGYPYLPVIFILFTVFYLGLTLHEDIRAYNAGEIPTIRSLMGVILVLMGTPFYFLAMRPRKINR